MRRYFALLLTVALASQIVSVPTTNAASWQAGRIIEDAIFNNKAAMSGSNIQSFFNGSDGRINNSKHSGATSSTCLKSYQTPSIKGSNTYGSNVSAATAIKQASDLFDINPQILLATLEKENGLITRGDCPSWRYRTAMGFACPDNGTCDPNYHGFSKQVYQAARHFRGYYDQQDGWFVPYSPGTRFIKYNPSSSCGGSNVTIVNRATAALYSYTPYQPNAATQAASPGVEVHCGAYGNINFWRYFTWWFGNPAIDARKDASFSGDWNNDTKTTSSVRRSNQYFLDNNNDGTAETNFHFGRSTDTTLVGDWDGDGNTEIAVRRGNQFFFDTNSDGIAEDSYYFGRSSDQAFVGDWDGDGRDEIGLKRGRVHYFDNNSNGGKAEVSYVYGLESDSPIVGDWDGDGRDEIAVRRGNKYYFDYGSNGGVADVAISFGRSSDRVFVGDWDDDNKDEIGLRRGTELFFDNSLNGKADTTISYGLASDKAVIGDWDGNGSDTIGMKRGSEYFLDNNNDGKSEIRYYYSY